MLVLGSTVLFLTLSVFSHASEILPQDTRIAMRRAWLSDITLLPLFDDLFLCRNTFFRIRLGPTFERAKAYAAQ